MTPEEKKKKAKPALAPSKRLSFAANLADAPESRGVREPTYFQKGTAGRHRGRSSNRSDRGRTGMGWQERIARNAQMDANYRAALGTSSAEAIEGSRSRTALTREGMSNRTVRDVARGRDETTIAATGMRTGALIANRRTMEAGLDRRQGKRQEFLGTQQENKFDFVGGENEKNRESRIQAIRESGAVDLAKSGVLEDPQQVRDYMESDEFSDGGLGAVESFNKVESRDYQYVPPQFKTRTNLKEGIVESEEVSPERVFDKTRGAFRRHEKPGENITRKYFDDATGKTTIPMNELTDTELMDVIKKLREKKK